jgi:hypothetical protein
MLLCNISTFFLKRAGELYIIILRRDQENGPKWTNTKPKHRCMVAKNENTGREP